MNKLFESDVKISISEKDFEELVELRRYFHRHPEPSLKEYNTSAKIKEFLTLHDIEHIPVGETGVLGVIRGKGAPSGKTVLLRADMDALEMKDRKSVCYASEVDGLHHACGHDGHTASLLIAAKLLKQQEHAFGGTIKLAFQQAEEIGAGARQFVQAGHLADVDFVFGIHFSAEYAVGKIDAVPGPRNASCDIFKIHVQGEASHAGRPHLGRDALLAASSIVVALQRIVSRTVDPLDPAVVGVGILNAGSRYNVVANDAYLEGTVRALTNETREHLLRSVESIASLTAQAHNTEIRFSNYAAADPLINHEEATYFVQQVAGRIVGDQNVLKNAKPSMWSEDFADFLEVTDGSFAYVGSKDPENPGTHYPAHHELFDLDERALAIAVQLHLDVALAFLKS